MKKTKLTKFISLLLCVAALLAFSACSENGDGDDTSSDSTQALETDTTGTEATVIGTGETKIYLDVVMPSQSLHYCIMTDKKTLGEALRESGLVEGQEDQYGLFITHVNGVKAVYDEDGAYWSVGINGEAAAVGVDSIEITADGKYDLTYTLA